MPFIISRIEDPELVTSAGGLSTCLRSLLASQSVRLPLLSIEVIVVCSFFLEVSSDTLSMVLFGSLANNLVSLMNVFLERSTVLDL